MSETTIPQDSFNVSPQQEQLWLAEPYGPSGLVQAVVALTGRLDTSALESALRATVQRHEVLRTTFVRQPGIRVPLQMIHAELHPLWRTLDLAAVEPAEAVQALERARRAELSEPFDFVNGPLVRALLVTRGDDQHTLVLTLSGLCADPSSVGALLGELVHHHSGVGQLVAEPLQYADYAEWQRDLTVSENEDARNARGFWSSFRDAVSPSLPFTKSAAASAFVPEEVTVDLGQASGAVDSALVQAAWYAVLARASGEDRVIVGVVGPLRRHGDLRGAIGAFGQPLPIQADVAGETTFADLLSRLRRDTDETATHEDYAPLAVGRGLAIGFLAPEPFHAQSGSLDVSLERVAISGPQFRLWLTQVRHGDEVRLRLSYDPRWLDHEVVTRLARRLELMIRGVAADANVALGELELLDEAERRELLIDFNQTAAPIPSQCVHELIAARAVVSPGRTAVVDERGSITYAELEARSNQLGHRLRRMGVSSDVPVGLCTEHSIGMIIGLLGILKAGGAYLPLHPEHPPARLGAQLETAGAVAIVTQEALLDRLRGIDGEIVCLDRADDRDELDAEPATPPETATAPDSLAYVIYTSGSTGTPKGVGVTHGNIANYATDIIGRLGADQEPLAFGLATSISTDLGNTSVFGALCSGGTLVLISPPVADGAALARQLEATPVDVLKITPSHITALLAGRDPNVLPRRWLVLGGERAPWDLIAKIRELSGVKVLNHYGPTETTVGSCTMEVGDGPGPFEPASVPIGRPIANTWCYVLDDRLRPAPLGVAGRLFIGGAGVARGYVGQPELTRERFVSDPFAVAGISTDGSGARMYDTGDRARWLPDRTLEFLGRSDAQVKIRGYRVEPAEVEGALRSHAQVNEAVVVARPSTSGELRLVAYCTTDGAASQDELRDHLKHWLPEHMLPSTIATLDELPRTRSGKVDRLALPDPATLTGPSHAHVPPRTEVESAVASLWSQLLGVDQIGVTDDFFELGGHSLLATQTVAQLRSEFAVDLPLHAMFLSPTVESLAAEIVRLTEEYEQAEAELSREVGQLSDVEAERRCRQPDATQRPLRR